MTGDREGDELHELSDDELDALLVAPRAAPVWAKAAATVLVLALWSCSSMVWWNNLILAPVGVLVVLGLIVRQVRRGGVGWYLAAAGVATAWSGLLVGAVALGPSTPTPPTVAGRPDDLTVEQQMAIDGAALDFYDVAYQRRSFEAYRRHVVGRPSREQVAGCWDGTPRPASPGSREVQERTPLDDRGVIDVTLGYSVGDVVYHVRLEVTPDDWQVVELDRVPGFESCPTGFPLPPGPG